MAYALFSYSKDTKITVGTGSTLVLSERTQRVYARLTNDSDEVIYLNLGNAAVLNRSIRLAAAGGYYEINSENLYTGAIYAICVSGSKALLVTEDSPSASFSSSSSSFSSCSSSFSSSSSSFSSSSSSFSSSSFSSSSSSYSSSSFSSSSSSYSSSSFSSCSSSFSSCSSSCSSSSSFSSSSYSSSCSSSFSSSSSCSSSFSSSSSSCSSSFSSSSSSYSSSSCSSSFSSSSSSFSSSSCFSSSSSFSSSSFSSSSSSFSSSSYSSSSSSYSSSSFSSCSSSFSSSSYSSSSSSFSSSSFSSSSSSFSSSSSSSYSSSSSSSGSCSEGGLISTDTGNKSPHTEGVIWNNWYQAENAYTDDANYALSTKDDAQDYGTLAFGIPAGAIRIKGIVVSVKGYRVQAGDTTMAVQLSWNEGANKSAAKNIVISGGAVEATKNVGGEWETWGHVWTVDELSNNNFWVGLTSNGDAGDDYRINHITVKVYYQYCG